MRLLGAGVSQCAKELDSRANIEVFDPGVPREELRRHYHDAAVFIMPSRYESFGMVLAEAMACGAAAVTTPTGFGYELEDRREVLRVPFGSPEALIEAVGRLIEDEPLRRSIADNGYRRVQGLTWESAGKQMEAFLQWIRAQGRKL